MIPALFDDIPRDLIDRFEHPTFAFASAPANNGHRLNATEYGHLLQGVGARMDEPVALYLHIPFCPVRCLYCGCHTTVTHNTERVDRYLDALETEMALVVKRLGSGRELFQVHVGGGTPNYLSDSQLIRLIGMIEQHFVIREHAEIGIECNPRRCSAGQLELLKSLGFNRVTFGVEDLDPAVQKAIGRINSAGLVRDVSTVARELGFKTICMEVVYGLPQQTPTTFRETLEQIIEMEPDRLSCFSYFHKPAVHPHQYAIAADSLPGPEQKLTLLHEAVNCMVDNGYDWIGIDCFARKGDALSRARSANRLRHNCMGYTDAPIRHLVALGMSSLGEVDGTLVQNNTDLLAWSDTIGRGHLPISRGHKLSEYDLRRREAVQHLICNMELPASLARGLEQEYERLGRCSEHGLVEVTDDCIRITPRGRYFLRSMFGHQDISADWSRNHAGIPQAV